MNGTTESKSLPLGWLVIGILSLVAFLTPIHGQAVTRVNSVGFTVSDMDRAVDFYTHILSFEKVSDREIWGADFEHLSGVFGARARVVDMKLGDETLELTEYLTPRGRPVPIDSHSNDRWFQHVSIIVSDMDKAYQVLKTAKVRHASTGPQTLPSYITAAAGIRAFYFKDLDDHVLEILQFPDGKGKEKWSELARTGRIFLGIDHTAIVVSDTNASLSFYRDAFGLTVAGTSDNYGPEQEHLNNVFGAKLHITGLKTKTDGINIEFLEYVAPRDGRPFPSDTRSSDLWHWQTGFAVTGEDDLVGVLFGKYRVGSISTGIVNFGDAALGFRRAAMVRDPDGHAVRLEER